MHLTEEQETAVNLCCDVEKRVVGVTGQAGTGKTTILREAHEKIPVDAICLAAPTGRAAKRIQEATGVKAVTIHRMMKYSMPDDDDDASLPAHTAHNPLPYKAVFIDEASMLDGDLYRNVVDALPKGGVIRFFGDANQLPPVNGPSPFLSLLDKWPSITLTQNFRSNDGIIAAATNILNGRAPQPNDKFVMMNPGVGNLLPAAEQFIDDTYRGLGSQIIIPTKKGKYGTWAINTYMQNKLNRKGRAIRIVIPSDDDQPEERVLRVGDKIIWTKNDYNIKLFNGQIGWISDLDDDTGHIICQFDDKEYDIPPLMEKYDERRGRSIFKYDPRRNIELAYAITTHKAQGSEFDRVLLMLNKSYVLNRNNFYTAVTRAKEKVMCLMGPGALHAAMQKSKL